MLHTWVQIQFDWCSIWLSIINRRLKKYNSIFGVTNRMFWWSPPSCLGPVISTTGSVQLPLQENNIIMLNHSVYHPEHTNNIRIIYADKHAFDHFNREINMQNSVLHIVNKRLSDSAKQCFANYNRIIGRQ